MKEQSLVNVERRGTKSEAKKGAKKWARNRKEGRLSHTHTQEQWESEKDAHTHRHRQREQDTSTHTYTYVDITTVKCQATFTRVDKYEANERSRRMAKKGAAGGNEKRQHIERFNVPHPALGESTPPRIQSLPLLLLLLLLLLILPTERRPLRPSACLASGVAAQPHPPSHRCVNLNILWGVSIVDVGAIVSATPRPP